MLEHFYAVETLEERLKGVYFDSDYCHVMPADVDNRPESIEPAHLKGSDLQLYRAARAFGLKVKIVPVVSLDHFGEDYDLQYGPMDPEQFSRPLSPGKLAVMRGFQDDPTGGARIGAGALASPPKRMWWSAKKAQQSILQQMAAATQWMGVSTAYLSHAGQSSSRSRCQHPVQHRSVVICCGLRHPASST